MRLCCPIPLPKRRQRRQRLKKVEGWDKLNIPFGSTACWRGYIASWRVADQKLYLAGIYGAVELVGEKPLHASWFSGTLCLMEQDIVVHEHLGYVTRFQPEITLQVEKGLVVSVQEEA